jgi:hypothetical protein
MVPLSRAGGASLGAQLISKKSGSQDLLNVQCKNYLKKLQKIASPCPVDFFRLQAPRLN